MNTFSGPPSVRRSISPPGTDGSPSVERISAHLDLLCHCLEDLRTFDRVTQVLARGAVCGERDPGSAWLAYARERADIDVDHLLDYVSALLEACRDATDRLGDAAAAHPDNRSSRPHRPRGSVPVETDEPADPGAV